MPLASRYAVVYWPRMAAQVYCPPSRLVILHERGRTFMASKALAGWRTGMSLARARRQYDHATFIERSHAHECAATWTLMQRLSGLTPRVMTLRAGCFLLQEPELIAFAHFVQQHGRVHGGVAPFSEWAQLAAQQGAPGTIRHVRDRTTFLEAMPVLALAGLLGDEGLEAAERLQLFGLHTLAMVDRRLTKQHLRAQFGHDCGTQLDHILRPSYQPSVPVFTPARNVSVAHELEGPTAIAAPWVQPVLARLAHRLAAQLTGMAALTLVLKAFMVGRGTVSRSYVSQRGLSSRTAVHHRVVQLHESLSSSLPSDEMLSLQLIASHLISATYTQRQLYAPRAETPRLQRAIFLIQQRYGACSVLQVKHKDSLFAEQRLTLAPFQQN